MEPSYKHTELTDKIIKAFYIVYNRLGYGFLEKVYENALMIELNNIGINAKRQVPVKVYYEGKEVGSYFADITVNELVMLELKACDAYPPANSFVRHASKTRITSAPLPVNMPILFLR